MTLFFCLQAISSTSVEFSPFDRPNMWARPVKKSKIPSLSSSPTSSPLPEQEWRAVAVHTVERDASLTLGDGRGPRRRRVRLRRAQAWNSELWCAVHWRLGTGWRGSTMFGGNRGGEVGGRAVLLLRKLQSGLTFAIVGCQSGGSWEHGDGTMSDRDTRVFWTFFTLVWRCKSGRNDLGGKKITIVSWLGWKWLER